MSLRAGFHGTVGQPSAQVIDGSLKFDGSKSQYLKRTPSSAGNRKKWTWSAWLKRDKFADDNSYHILFSTRESNSNRHYLSYNADVADELFIYDHTNGNNKIAQTNAKYRDTGWYHVVVIYDTTNGDGGQRLRFFINGVENDDWGSYQTNSENFEGLINSVTEHRLGGEPNSPGFFYGRMSQCYFIDGQALGPSYFGFTDPLTGTWRPKLLKDGDQATPNTHLLYNVNTSDNGFDSSSTSRTYDVTSREFSTYTTPQTANPGGYGANSAHVYKSPTGYAITWIVSTSTSDRYIWTSEDGVNWTSKGSFYDTDGASQSVTSTYIALAGGANASNVTVTSATVDFGTNGFHLPMDGTSPIGIDKSGKGNDWTPVNFGGSNSLEKATGALPILNTDGSGKVANVGTRTDENSSNLVLALPLNANGDDVHHLIKGSGSAKTITTGGSPAVDTDSNLYGSAIDFTASLTTGYYPSGTQTDFTFGTGDFTVEFWFKPTSTSRQYMTDFRNNGSGSGSGNNKPFVIFADNGSDGTGTWIRYANDTSSPNFDLLGGTGLPTSNTWHHLAIVRSSGTVYGYLNGTLTNSATDNTNYSTDDSVSVGNSSAVTLNFDGSIQDYRIYKGVAKYTSNFIPASTNPDILPDTPSGVSGSSKLTKITEGAVSFGSKGSDNMEVAESSDFGFGTGDWTVEGYFYVSKSGNNRVLWDLRPSNDYYFLRLSGTSSYIFQHGSSTKSFSADDNRWNHIAISRSSGTTKIFVNGIETNSFSDSTNSSTGTLRLSSFRDTTTSSSDYGFEGQLSNFRIVKGTALYTSNFTPPTEPLTNVTNTKLLCCQSNTIAGRAAVSPNLGGANDGTVWSEQSYIIPPSSGFNSGGEIQYAFDGSITTLTSGAGSRTETFEIYFPKGITVSTSLEVYMSSGASQFKINDGSFSSSLNNGAWRDLSFTGTLSKLTVKGDEPQTYGDFAPRLSAIRIDGSTILTDPLSPKGNVSATTFNPFNTDINTVRGQETSYCTWNPLVGTGTLSDGNLKFSGADNWKNTDGTISFSSGKWYYEGTYIGSQYGSSQGNIAAGIGFKKTIAYLPEGSNAEPVNNADYRNNTIAFYQNGYFTDFGTGTGTHTSIRSQIATDDVVGVSIDLDNGSYEFYLNGLSITSGTVSYTGELVPWAEAYYANAFVCNFGQKPFKFPPPDGFQPLNAANVRPEKVITRPDQYVGVKTYTGDNSDRFIDVGFKPDLSYFARRNTAGYIKYFFDSVRGATKTLATSHTQGDDAEGTATDGLKSFDPSGVTIGNNTQMNENNGLYVSWHWKAGGNKNTFNVDDVGYANASDVNMNVGGLNSVVYDTSQVWSNYLTRSGGSGFTNQGSGAFAGYDDASNYTYVTGSTSGTNYTVTFTPPSRISYYEELIIRVESGNSEVSIDGGKTYVADTGGLVTFKGSGSFTSIICRDSRGQFSGEFNSIRVDGVLLVDNGTTPPNAPSIAATGCSVGTKQGFSIIKYTGNSNNSAQSIPHGLGKTPTFIMTKALEATGDVMDWRCYHQSLGNTEYIAFNSNAAAGTFYDWANTSPTNQYFNVGGFGNTQPANESKNYIAYVWTDVPGLQKFGNYLSQGGNDANYVHLGFRPAILWIKSADHSADTTSWCIFTDEIDKTNPFNNPLYANNNGEEGKRGNNVNSGTFDIDLLSDGFKIRTNVGEINEGGSGNYYLYCAWAKEPSINLYGGQSPSR